MQEIIDLIDNGEVGDAFEQLAQLKRLDSNLLQLEKEYTKAVSSRDPNYEDRLKTAVRIAFRNANATPLADSTEESIEPEIEVSIETSFKPHIVQSIIPQPESYFVGREADLIELETIFKENNFIAIVGSGGMGKTQLVSKYLEKNPIPKEQLCWIQCEPTTSLDSIMEQLGFAELLKTKDQKNLVKIENFLYRLEQEKRYLFLEDYHDINEKELIENCLNHSKGRLRDSKIIIISRDKVRNIKLSPRQLDLKGFQSDEDLLALIDKLSTFFNFKNASSLNQTDLLSLAKQRLEGHPLAIYLAFHLLESGTSIKDIEREIINLGDEEMVANKKETISERLLNAIFKRSDASEEEKQFIKEFSVFRGMVKEEVISAVLDRDYSDTTNKLKRKNILKFNRNDSDELYYYLHPLVREFCYEQLKIGETGIARSITLHSNVAAYFINKRSTIISVIEEERIHYHLIRANAWDQIAKDIEELGEAMIAQGHLNHLENLMNHLKGSYAQVPKIALAFRGTILYQKGRIDEAAEFFLQAENESHFKTRIKGILGYGELLYHRGKVEDAYENFTLVLELLKTESNFFLRERVFALISIGVYKHHRGNYDESLQLYKQAEELAQKNDLRSELVTTLSNTGALYESKGIYDKALMLYKQSLEISEQLGQQPSIAIALNDIADIHEKKGKYDEALILYKQSLVIDEQLGQQSRIACSFNNIANIHKNKGKYDEALVLYKKSLDIYEQLGHQSSIAGSFNNIANIHKNKGKYDEALVLYKKSLDIYEQLGHQSGIAVSLNDLANTYSDKGEYNKALNLYKQSLEIDKKLGRKPAIAISLSNIGFLKKKQNKIPETIYYVLQSLFIKNSLQTPYKTQLSRLLNIKKEIGLKTYKQYIEQALLQYDQDLQTVFTEELRQEIFDAPIRKQTTIKRNDKVEVQYPDGTIKILKYKKVEAAHRNGEVEILRMLPKD
jgi:tetratricopeptide (TPR) repeat protein